MANKFEIVLNKKQMLILHTTLINYIDIVKEKMEHCLNDGKFILYDYLKETLTMLYELENISYNTLYKEVKNDG